MSIAPAADIFPRADSGTPTRLVWHQRRYRVVAGQALRTPVPHDSLTHPLERLIGWSLVATADLKPAHVRVMQVRPTGRQWVLTDVDPA